ncbi:glycosyl transferase, family 2 [Legionella gratiana]|uniref:Glycosyl transferase, family 2 n=1 Tax=Legionella gratiana TaxID=45066 RepID=A0A378J0F1_9GAMM|nr:glycosyltransferase [Legionella gratiana]KTD11590.1 glycosyl transferase, family 2 [Legionella gratiana]STX41202.1 glycosyl transferase, family 2 [Legionella gratiana]
MHNKDVSNPLVSLVIPAYNAEKYIMTAIDSILQQTYSPIELIVVNDGSTDNTEQLLTSHQDKFKVFSQKNLGQSAAMNLGWEQSSGSILGYLSADDRLHPKAISILVAQLLVRPEIIMVYPDFCIIDENANYVRSIKVKDYDLQSIIADFNCLPGPGALFRREAWASVGGWNTKLHSIPDVDFYLRLCLHGSFLRVPKALADFRVHSGSTTYSPSSVAKADEPLMVVQGFFSHKNLPSSFLKWRKRSIANALMLSGFMHGYSGRYMKFIARMVKAGFMSPSALMTRKMVSYFMRIFRR